MSKIDPLVDLTSTYGAVAALNANFSKIATAIDNTLSRDGSYPNQMEADLDLNHFNILNLGNASDLKGPQGDPGGNAMSIGVFTGGSAQTIPTGFDLIRTSGYSTVGQGSAFYVYDATINSAYVTANPRTSFVSANGRGFRLDSQQRLTIQMFGGKADGTSDPLIGAYLGTLGATDNAPALAAALALVRSNILHNASSTANFYRAGAAIHFPTADGVYDFQSAVSIDTSVKITGDSGPGGGQGGSILRWRPGMHGLIVQMFGYTWSGAATQTATPLTFGAGSTIIDGLQLYQHRTGNDLVADEYHGILVLSPVTIKNFVCSGWSGSGICGIGSVPSSNVNNCLIEGGSCYGNEHGIFVDGGDSNVWAVLHVDCSVNRGYGFFDSSFLGNTWIACHADGNGVAGSSASFATIATMTTSGGKWYYVRANQAVGASTNAPSGTTASNTWWGYISAGSADTAHPAWVSGTTFREGGAYRSDSVGNARTAFIGCYSEGTNGGASFFTYPNFVIGGLLNGNTENAGASIFDNALGVTTLTTPISVTESLRIDGNLVLGPRKTGWTADTGTAERTARATYVAGANLTFSATYVQAEQTALATRLAAVEAALQNVTRSQKAIKDDLINHGAIGT